MSTTSHRDLALPCSLLQPLLLYLMYPSVYQCLEVWLAFLLFSILTFVFSKPPILPGLCHLTIPLSTTLPTTIICCHSLHQPHSQKTKVPLSHSSSHFQVLHVLGSFIGPRQHIMVSHFT